METANNIIPRVSVSPRQNLGPLLPLEAPFAIDVSISSFCNLKCKFCFHYENDFKKELMDISLFKKIVDDLEQFQRPIKKVRFSGSGESLIHPQFLEMLRYLSLSKVAETINLTTNGLLLTEQICEAIVESGLNQIYVSVEAVTSDGYYDIAGQHVNVNKLAQMIEYLYQYKQKNNPDFQIYVKTVDKGLKCKEEEELFYSLFNDKCDHLFIERVINHWPGSNNKMLESIEESQGLYGEGLKHNKICPLLFTTLAVSQDGLVVSCCADWNKQYVVGDLRMESVKEIWNKGELLNKMRTTHLSYRKDDIPICSGCNLYDILSPDNIDEYSEEILARMEAKVADVDNIS